MQLGVWPLDWRGALLAAAAVVALLVALTGKHLWKAFTSKRAPDFDVERYYKDEAGKLRPFGGLDDEPQVYLSVIVPAYKEEKRIKPMMTEMLEFLEKRQLKDVSFTWEVLIVDDGSPDGTSAVVYDTYVKRYGSDRIRLLTLFRNNGKGGAVRKGMVRARGAFLLMADADGATRASDLSALLDALKRVQRDGLGIAVGSRAHLEEAGDAKAKRTPLRKVLMWGFHTLITVMLGSGDIRDTQCGFKLFTRAAAGLLFPVQHIDRWAFDVELLYLANVHRIPVVEVPVNWTEIDGSTLDVVTATIQMARDIIAIRLSYMMGVWKTAPSPSTVLESGKLDTSLIVVGGTPAGSSSAGVGAGAMASPSTRRRGGDRPA